MTVWLPLLLVWLVVIPLGFALIGARAASARARCRSRGPFANVIPIDRAARVAASRPGAEPVALLALSGADYSQRS